MLRDSVSSAQYACKEYTKISKTHGAKLKSNHPYHPLIDQILGGKVTITPFLWLKVIARVWEGTIVSPCPRHLAIPSNCLKKEKKLMLTLYIFSPHYNKSNTKQNIPLLSRPCTLTKIHHSHLTVRGLWQ